MADEDRLRWNEKYCQGGDHASPQPSPLLTAIDSLLPHSGRAIDLAGGAGRHAISFIMTKVGQSKAGTKRSSWPAKTLNDKCMMRKLFRDKAGTET